MRVIDAGEWQGRRFGWMKSVREDAKLSMTARMAAHVLALDFANHKTGECSPGPRAVANVLGVSVDTAKRAIAELVAAGWVDKMSLPGGGRGNTAQIVFLCKARIVPLKGVTNDPLYLARKGGARAPVSEGAKGGRDAPVSENKGGQICVERGANLRNPPTPPYKDKPYSNHKGPTSTLDERAEHWSKVISEGRHIPQSAISPILAERMIELGLVDAETLKRKRII